LFAIVIVSYSLLLLYVYLILDVDSTFFGSNFEIYFDRTTTAGGSLCAFGPTSDVLTEYVFSCFGGPKSGRSMTIFNKYSSSVKLCDVKLMGKSKSLACRCSVLLHVWFI